MCENGGRTFLRNDTVRLPDYMILLPRREYLHIYCRGKFKSHYYLYFLVKKRRIVGWLVGNEQRRETMRLLPNFGHHFAICPHGPTETPSQNGCWQAQICRRELPNTKQEYNHGNRFPLFIISIVAFLSENLKGKYYKNLGVNANII
jgi:hypothetical protein